MTTTCLRHSLLLMACVALACVHAVPEGFKVYRDVRDYGAVGDGKADDTAAFIAALTTGKATIPRPGPWNNSQYGCQTLMPSHVFVPNGTYRITATLPVPYYTQLVGEYHHRPVLVFDASAITCLDAGTDEGPGNGWYGGVNQDNFYRQIRNIIVNAKACAKCVGVHWQVSQATNIVNTDILNGNGGTGIYMESGSGGYLGDIRIVGGSKGMSIGNQQFTFRNVSIEDTYIAVDAPWNWLFTFVDLRMYRSEIGILTGSSVGTINLIDCYAEDVKKVLGIYGHPTQLYVENFQMVKIQIALQTLYTTVTEPITDYMIGRDANGTFVDGPITPPRRQSSLLNATSGKYFGMTRPNYDDTVRLNLTNGTDVTFALQLALLEAADSGRAVLVPYGTYLITGTVRVPKGTRLYGEAWTRFAATGDAFADASAPIPVFALGQPGDVGVMQIADVMFTNVGPIPGAVMVQWNIRGPNPGDCGLWDVHYRIGGAAGTKMGNECYNVTVPSYSVPGAANCTGAHTLLHLTASSGNVYLENVWGWVADHDIDGHDEVNIFNARGLLSESGAGGVWLYGTAMEHSYTFQYNIASGADHFIGAVQTETPYYQPLFALNASTPRTSWVPSDPSFSTAVSPSQMHAYALVVQQSSAASVYLYGAGFYSFFRSWSTQSCGSVEVPCQTLLALFNRSAVANGTSVLHVSMLNTHGAHDVAVMQRGAVNFTQYPALQFPNGFCQTLSSVGGP